MAAGPLRPKVPLHPMAFGGGMDRGDPLQRAMFALNSQRPQEAERIAGKMCSRPIRATPKRCTFSVARC